MRRHRFLGLLAAAFLSGGLAGAAAWAQTTGPVDRTAVADAEERTLTVGGTVAPLTLHPMLEATSSKAWIMGLLYRGLIAVDRNARMVCLICTELPTLANGRIRQVRRADGSLGADIDFTLREDAAWGDGTPVTSDDVAFALEVGRHPAMATAVPDLYTRDVLGITVSDARSFTLHRATAGCSLIALKDINPLPAHLERPVFTADPKAYRSRSLYITAATTPGLWNGPYRIRDVEPGIFVTAVPNPGWRGTAPPLERVTFRGFATTASLESAFLAGVVDALPGETGLRVDQAEALAARADKRFRLVIQPALVHEHLDVNHANPLLADPEIRRALLMALDRETMARTLLGGQVILATSDVHPADPVHLPPAVPHRFDRFAASALLDRLGWTVDSAGRRVDGAGRPMVIDIVTTAGHKERELVMRFVKESWESLGITVRTAAEPARVLYAKTQPERRFPGLVLFSWRSPPAFPRRSTLHSSSIPTPANGHSGQNYGGYVNADMDRIIEGIEAACGPDQITLWTQYQELYARELPSIPLFFWGDAALLPPWLEGAEPSGQQFPATLWVESWRVHDRGPSGPRSP